MDYNDKILELFSGDLSKEERDELSAEVGNNEQLLEDLKLQQEVLFAIENGDDDTLDFRQQLKDIGQEFVAEQDKRHRIHPGVWMAAASVVVVLGLASLLGLFQSSEYSGSYAFSEYYEPYGTDMVVRGEGHFNQLDKAIGFYQNGNMALALSEFERLERENIELSGFFSALCYMEMGDFDKAKGILNGISNDAIFYSDQINWYLALCYLKDNEESKAEVLLHEVVKGNNQYSAKASEILKKLDL